MCLDIRKSHFWGGTPPLGPVFGRCQSVMLGWTPKAHLLISTLSKFIISPANIFLGNPVQSGYPLNKIAA